MAQAQNISLVISFNDPFCETTITYFLQAITYNQ